MSAGHVVQVCLIALLTAAFLNAPGIKKTAEGQEFGWQRNVGRPIAYTVNAISHFLYLDRPREWLLDGIGQGGADDIKDFSSITTVPFAAPGTPGAPSPTLPPKQKFYTPDQPLSIWIAGDSLSKVPGDSFRGKADANAALRVVAPVDTQIATGLSRPEVFFWPDFIRQKTAELNPDVVMLTFGANDDQATTGPTVGPMGSDAWKQEYALRVGATMDQIIAEGRYVVWVGVPIIRNNQRNDRYRVLNEIYKQEADKRKGRAFYVDTYDLFKLDDGSYSDFAKDNPALKVRAPDGIHFERAGGDMIADRVLKLLGDQFDLETWKTGKTLAPSTTRAQ